MKKVKAKKRAKITTRKSKPQALSTKRTSKSDRGKNNVGGSVKPEKNRLSAGNKGNRFVKGISGNPKGRTKGSKNVWSLHEFQKEFIADENKHKGSIYKYFFKRARKNDVVLIALQRKWQPDLKSIEQVTLASDSMTVQEAADIRKEMRKRFETK